MTKVWRIYYYALFGAIGGVVAWQLSNWLGLSMSSNLYLNDALLGALLGFCFGFPIGSVEGFIARSPIKLLKGGIIGGLLGMAAGAVALPLGEAVFAGLGAGALGRAAGWALFGGFIGLVEGVTGGAEMWKGGIGGAIGGAMGGLLLELTQPLGTDLTSGKAFGLILLGISIAAMIALMVVLLSRAWLEVADGKLKGTTFILDKFMTPGGPSAIIGSSPLKSEIVLPDPDIAPQHAMMIGAGTYFSLKDLSLKGTYLEGRKIEQATLANGSQIQMGNTTLRYHERR